MSDINLNFSMDENSSLMNVHKKITQLLRQKYSSEDDYTPGSDSNADSIMNSVINSIDNASKLAYAISLAIKTNGKTYKEYIRSDHMYVDTSNNINSIKTVLSSLMLKLKPLIPTNISYAQPSTIQLFYDRFESFEKLYDKAEKAIKSAESVGLTDKIMIPQLHDAIDECTVLVKEFDLLVKEVKSNYNYTQKSSSQISNNEEDTEVAISNTSEDKIRGGSYLYYIDKLR